MKNTILLSSLAATVLIFHPCPAHADMANGSYSVDAGAYVPLWDLSEYYDSDVGIGGLEFTIAQNPTGAFSGSGDLYIDDEGINLDMPATVNGKVSGSSIDPKVSLDALATFSGDYDGVYFNFIDATIKLTMQVDSADDDMAGTGTGNVKYSAINPNTNKTITGNKTVPTGPVEFSLPNDVTGDWQLYLDLTPNGTKYTGTAEIMTSVGDTVDFNVTGTYSSKTDTSSLKLTGTGWGTGTSLDVVISTSGSTFNTIDTVKGKLFGQTLKF